MGKWEIGLTIDKESNEFKKRMGLSGIFIFEVMSVVECAETSAHTPKIGKQDIVFYFPLDRNNSQICCNDTSYITSL